MKLQNLNNKRGFTIIEVVLVLAIAGLIFLIVFLAVPALQASQRDTQRRNDVGRVFSQLVQYSSNNQGQLPQNTNQLTDFETRYLTVNQEDFKDPTTGNTYDMQIQANRNQEPALGQIYYYTNSKCDGENVVAGSGSRSITVRTKLERGSLFCQDNS